MAANQTITLADLTTRLFVNTAEAAALLGSDPRTVRAMARRREIPSSRAGSRVLIPVSWLREQAGASESQSSGQVDLDQLADRVVDRLIDRLSRLIASGFGPAVEGEER